jgi:DtxR family Mn-dependent transcriptional regulator
VITKQQKSTEDYLKTIYQLAETESPVTTSRISEARQVRPASVTSMLQKLDGLNLVAYKKHQGVTLTEEGEAVALKMIRQHRLLELYLTEVLGFDWHEVHEEAEALEHVMSEKLEDRIAAALNYPSADPHGAPIPHKDGTLPELNTRPLSSLATGETAVVTLVSDDTDRELLCYLAELGVIPGAQLTIIDTAPYEGPITAEVGDQRQVIGRRAALAVEVT